MSIRRKSTTHDLATLRLHPDGSRVQQSSINMRLWKFRSTVPDTRGNWIARDAGGRADVSKVRSVSTEANDQDGEIFDINPIDDLDLTIRTNAKGKQKATETDAGNSSGERTGKNFRSRKRSSFIQDWSFLAPSPCHFIESGSESSSEDDSSSESVSEAVKITFPDPSPELLKCIHHFASRYYQEKGVLSDRSKGYRDERRSRRFRKGEDNIHYRTTAKPALWTRDSSPDGSGGDEWEDEDESEDIYEPSSQREHTKDMYKALDGSALVAIGVILQEQIAHAMTTSFSRNSSHRVRQGDDCTERNSFSP